MCPQVFKRLKTTYIKYSSSLLAQLMKERKIILVMLWLRSFKISFSKPNYHVKVKQLSLRIKIFSLPSVSLLASLNSLIAKHRCPR